MNTVSVTKIERVNMPAIKAFVTVKVGGLTVNGVRVIMKDRPTPGVYLPKHQVEGKWEPLVEADPDTMKAIREAVLAAWKGDTAPAAPSSHPDILPFTAPAKRPRKTAKNRHSDQPLPFLDDPLDI